MMVALGEIQKHLGPDTRVSTTADILDERVETNDFYLNQNYDPNLSVSNGIDLNGDDQYNKTPFGQRYWTGVWKHRGKSKGGLQPGARPTQIFWKRGILLIKPSCLIPNTILILPLRLHGW